MSVKKKEKKQLWRFAYADRAAASAFHLGRLTGADRMEKYKGMD